MESSIPVHLNPADVPPVLLGGYSGRRFKAVVTDRVSIPIDAGLWSGGSRQTYRMVRLADGAELPLSDSVNAPWSPHRKEQVVTLEPGIVVICHSTFNGKDMGLTFYVHPNDAVKMLPSSDNDVSDMERQVLNVIGGIKSAYRRDELRRKGISIADYEAAKTVLFQKGLIDKRGAITVAGRNARHG